MVSTCDETVRLWSITELADNRTWSYSTAKQARKADKTCGAICRSSCGSCLRKFLVLGKRTGNWRFPVLDAVVDVRRFPLRVFAIALNLPSFDITQQVLEPYNEYQLLAKITTH